MIPNCFIISNGEPYVGDWWSKYPFWRISAALAAAIFVRSACEVSGFKPALLRSLFTKSTTCAAKEAASVCPDVLLLSLFGVAGVVGLAGVVGAVVVPLPVDGFLLGSVGFWLGVVGF
ncbi:hypothetical protein D3C77_580760 [compost metagenome]